MSLCLMWPRDGLLANMINSVQHVHDQRCMRKGVYCLDTPRNGSATYETQGSDNKRRSPTCSSLSLLPSLFLVDRVSIMMEKNL